MSRVFISHSSRDREFVEGVLVPVLHGCGLETWYSGVDIQAADRWERTILKGLESSDWFLIVLSPNSANSDWVLDELHWAMAHRPLGRIVPVMIEPCDPYAFHIRLPRLQFVDFVRDREAAIARLRTLWARPDAPPSPPPPKEEPVPALITTQAAGIPLRLIPAGTFPMGSPDGEGDDDEHPRHEVTISRPFYLGVHPVTQGQYATLMGGNPSHFAATGQGKDRVAEMDTARLPVESVSWLEAVQFCNALGRAEGLEPSYEVDGGRVELAGVPGFRLPTEAEWEYACRAGTSTPWGFAGGEDQLHHHAWFARNNVGRTQAVGETRANAFGIQGMHGNVCEWVFDNYQVDYYANSPGIDPPGPAWGANRVFRGGGWSYSPRDCRSARRFRGAPGSRFHDLGFRVGRFFA